MLHKVWKLANSYDVNLLGLAGKSLQLGTVEPYLRWATPQGGFTQLLSDGRSISHAVSPGPSHHFCVSPRAAFPGTLPRLAAASGPLEKPFQVDPHKPPTAVWAAVLGKTEPGKTQW